MTESNIHSALVKAWGSIENPELDSENLGYKRNGKPSKYASLKSTLGVIRTACTPAGLMYKQILAKNNDGSRELRSCVMNGNGDVLELSNFPVETPPNPQSFGSNLTYAKRQQAQADWGIAGEEDDDGAAAVMDDKRHQSTAKPAPSKSEPNKINPCKKLWGEVADAKRRAIEMGIKEEGITAWSGATIVTTDGSAKPMTDYTAEEITKLRDYILQLISDVEQIRAEREKAPEPKLADEDIAF